MPHFERLTIGDREFVDAYMRRYGEKSAHHSFASLWCFDASERAMIAEQDDFLLVRRTAYDTEDTFCCMPPFGDARDEEGFGKAVDALLAGARAENKVLCFRHVTAGRRALLERLYPGGFTYTPSRDHAEYLYKAETLAALEGGEMQKRRAELRRFERNYGDRITVKDIGNETAEDIRAFQRTWLAERIEAGASEMSLTAENDAVTRALDSLSVLRPGGVVLYLDGRVCGYEIGFGISENTFDSMFAKGDRNVKDVYRKIHNEMAMTARDAGYAYINLEEDLGDAGLRKTKTEYHPIALIEMAEAKAKM